jgi:hypothetical protein
VCWMSSLGMLCRREGWRERESREGGAPRHDQPRRAGGCVWESQTSWLTLGQWMSDLGCWSLYAFVVLLLIDDFTYFGVLSGPLYFSVPPPSLSS